jgi:hypothetical protein
MAYVNNYYNESDHMEIEERKQYKYGSAYLLSTQVAAFVDRYKTLNRSAPAVVLLPPNSYLKEKQMNVAVPEPVVFYYYTGLHAVWTDSPNVDSANWVLMVNGSKMQITHIEDKNQLHLLLSRYKNYQPRL